MAYFVGGRNIDLDAEPYAQLREGGACETWGVVHRVGYHTVVDTWMLCCGRIVPYPGEGNDVRRSVENVTCIGCLANEEDVRWLR